MPPTNPYADYELVPNWPRHCGHWVALQKDVWPGEKPKWIARCMGCGKITAERATKEEAADEAGGWEDDER